jgi:HPt (histidine-containing phosphotransfer) domain-containing protein
MDLTLLQNLMGGDEKLVSHFVQIFKNQVPAQVASLSSLCADEDWESLSTALHSLKTQFTYVGLTDFSEQMRSMEEDVDNGETTSIPSRIDNFLAAFNAFWNTEFPVS